MAITVTRRDFNVSDAIIDAIDEAELDLIPRKIRDGSFSNPDVYPVWSRLLMLPRNPINQTVTIPPLKIWARNDCKMSHQRVSKVLDSLNEWGLLTIHNKQQKKRERFVCTLNLPVLDATFIFNSRKAVKRFTVEEGESAKKLADTMKQAGKTEEETTRTLHNIYPEQNDKNVSKFTRNPGRLFNLPDFINAIKLDCTHASDGHGKRLCDFSDSQIIAACSFAPDAEIAIAIQEVDQFVPKKELKFIGSLEKLLARRFMTDEKKEVHLNPAREFHLDNETFLLEAYAERAAKYIRPCDFHPDPENFFTVDNVEKICGALFAGLTVERGEIPIKILRRFEFIFDSDKDNPIYVKLKPYWEIRCQKRGYWWIVRQNQKAVVSNEEAA